MSARRNPVTSTDQNPVRTETRAKRRNAVRKFAANAVVARKRKRYFQLLCLPNVLFTQICSFLELHRISSLARVNRKCSDQIRIAWTTIEHAMQRAMLRLMSPRVRTHLIHSTQRFALTKRLKILYAIYRCNHCNDTTMNSHVLPEKLSLGPQIRLSAQCDCYCCSECQEQCSDCGTRMCLDCIQYCDCGRAVCGGCMQSCCGVELCSACRLFCELCEKLYGCQYCAPTDEDLCESCRKTSSLKEEEEDLYR